MKTYRDATRYLDELAQEQTLNRSYLGLERISLLLSLLGNPHRRFPSVHIGGTSGKGSTVTLLRAMLQAQGYRVGSTISPHLEDVRERVQLNGRNISKKDFIRLLAIVARANERARIKRPDLGRPTYFETLTALAFLYFAKKKVDIAVVEVGLGGRLDATNVLMPEVSVITTIQKDHTKILGNTLARIAFEKGGIIKPRIPIVLGDIRGSARSVLLKLARRHHAPVRQYRKAFQAHTLSPSTARHERFHWEGRRLELKDLDLALLGPHQIHNASVALAALELLAERGFHLNEVAIRRALANITFAGRMEVLGQHPTIIGDGAHNPAKISAAVQATRERFSYRRLIVVFSAKAQKDIRAMLRIILPHSHTLIVTEIPPTTPDGHILSPSVDQLAKLVSSIRPSVRLLLEPQPQNAITRARQDAKKNDLILVTGSLFLLSVVRPMFRQKTKK